MKKNWLGIIKSAVLLGLVAICMMVSAKDVKAETYSGNCGKSSVNGGADVTWSFDSENETLTIGGNGGEMFDTAVSENVKWHAYSDRIKKVIIQEGVTTIGGCAFFGCTNLESIEIANSVTKIRPMAFMKCSSLSSITIPNSVTVIGYDAFQYCNKLTNITIPNSVTVIGYGAFQYCTSLTSVTISNNVSILTDALFDGCSNLTHITIPSSVTKILTGIFNNCSKLTTITFEGNPTTINSTAFNNCKPTTVIFNDENITTSTINKVLTEAAMDTSVLNEVVVPDALAGDEALSSSIREKITTKSAYIEKHNPAPKAEVNEEKTASEGTPTGPSKSVYEEKMDSLVKEISTANSDAKKSADGKKTVSLNGVTSLSLSAMKALKSNPNVNLDMTYTYKGIAFHVVIPAGTAVFDESIPWYGPLWLYAHFGQGTLTDVNNSNANVYLVQSGDTLRKIAARYGLTLEELVKKNPQIKNVDRISIGDKIFY